MKKKMVTITLVLLVFILIGGVSYAFFNYYKESANSQFVSGNIYLKLDDETDSISLPNAFPETKDKARSRNDNTLTFTVKGKNTSEKDVMYSIELNNGVDSIDNTKSRFDAEDLLFDLVEIDGNTRTYLINALGYNEFNYTKIWDEIVKANTDDEVSHTYELRVWINQDVKFGEGEGVKYTSDEYAKKYATIKIAVSGNSLDDEYYKVSFDGQGGEVKRAYYYTRLGDNYDNLYTPEKDGYVFLGWNGKNIMPDFSSRIVKHPGGGSNNTYKRDNLKNGIYLNMSSGNNYRGGWDEKSYEINYTNNTLTVYSGGSGFGVCIDGIVKNDIQYTFSGILNNAPRRFGFYQEDGTYIDNTSNKTFTTPSDAYRIIQCVSRVDTTLPASLQYLQIEEGDVATEWEPYYVTSDIEVTEWNTPMVLTAKWKLSNVWSNYRYNDELRNVDIVYGQSYNDYVNLNGESNYVIVGMINGLSTVSMEVTAKINELSDGSTTPVLLGNLQTGGLCIYLSKQNKIAFQIYLNGYGYVSVESTTTADKTNIHDYVGVYDGTTIKLYIDGVLDSTLDVSEIISSNNLTGNIRNPDNDTVMMIGCNPNGNVCSSDYYDGNIYSARIYDYAISQSKIIENINSDGFISLGN